LIFGDFNDWQPEPMLRIFEFSEIFESKMDVQHILTELKHRGQIDESHTSPETLNEKEMMKFDKNANKFKTIISREWSQTIEKHCVWR
jgi:hypothetical protein